jgi:uncharacterized hydrophobic protein (TIGR00341 family)
MYRSIEMVIPSNEENNAINTINDLDVLNFNYLSISNSLSHFKIIIKQENTEKVLDVLQNQFSSLENFNLILQHIDVYLPTPITKKNEKLSSLYDIKSERISRAEIYRYILGMTKINSIYLLMVILSSLVAAVGVLNNNVALIIGAMIIAPLMGPGIGLSYGIVMGDKNLVFMAMKSTMVGVMIAIVISVFLGLILTVNPTIPSIITRTNVGQGGFVVALASGFAGALAVITELSSTLVGVMIGISLMPPLVTFGLLIGSGDYFLAWGAFLIFIVNLVCIYFASLITFYKAGLKPLDQNRVVSVQKSSKIYIYIFLIVLIALFIINIYQTGIWDTVISS